MKIAVIGAGAIGSLVAGYLFDKNEEVVLVARHEQVLAISRDGLNIEGIRGRLSVKLPVKSQLDEQFNLVILATKTQDLEKAISENSAYLKDTNILSLQNGIRADSIISQKLNKKNLISSIIMFGATYLAPGRVIHNFEGDWILGAIYPEKRGTLEEVAGVTSKIFTSPLTDDILGMKWFKLFLNANNCLPAILGRSMQEIFRNLSICRISLSIWKEGLDLVSKADIKLKSLPNFPLERLIKLASLPPHEGAQVFSKIMVNLSKEPLYGSILQSIKRNRRSEIDYINGEFVNLADSIGQRAPLNEKLVQMVHGVEDNGRYLSEGELINQTKQLLN
jgi:2-dehydropantoate 2-reductase